MRETNKVLVATIAVLIITVSCIVVLADSVYWQDTNLPITATPSSGSQNLQITSDMNAISAVAGYNFSNFAQNQTYEWTFYIFNNESSGEYITYLPSNYGESQTSVELTATVVEYGVPDQIPNANMSLQGTGVSALPYALPEKDTTNPTNGFYLMPAKMIKIDVQVTVIQSDSTPINIPFEIAGAFITGISPSGSSPSSTSEGQIPANVQWQDYNLPLTANS